MIAPFDADDDLDRTLAQLRRNPRSRLMVLFREVNRAAPAVRPHRISTEQLERHQLVPWKGRVFGMECE